MVGQLIPDSYLELEKRILLERKNVPVEFPVIDQKRLLELVQESQLQLDENELPHAIHFLNESGKILPLMYVVSILLHICSRQDLYGFLNFRQSFCGAEMLTLGDTTV